MHFLGLQPTIWRAIFSFSGKAFSDAFLLQTTLNSLIRYTVA